MRLIHNSRLPQFRTPFGAVTTGTSVSLSVILEDADPNQATLTLRTWVDEIGESRYPMTYEGDGIFSVELECTEPCLIWYSFICNIEGQPEVRLGAPQGRTGGEGVTYDYAEVPSFQITVYRHRDNRPTWYERGMVYQIFPDRYARDEHWRERTLAQVEKPRNGIQRRMVEDWNEPPVYERAEDGSIKTWDFYGGSLKGIQEDLPRIAELGFTAIYLNPIFEAHSNHRYNTADYLNVDPLLGTNEEFEVLCREAAKYGIGIVLDGVFSHTGSDSRYFNREGRYGEGGAYRDPNSPYRSWYDFDPKYKGGYRSWWGFETLPEVNEETPSFVEFITGEGGVIDTWLRRGAVGFRLDVADELPDAFIEKIRTAVKRVSPEKFLLGEVWEDATTKFGFDHRRTYLLGKGLDSVMNYPFKNSVLDFVKGKPAQQAANEILSICEHYPAPAINTALNFLSTHDTERALTVIADEPANGRGREWQSGRSVTGEAYEEGMLRLRMAYAIIYTLPGVPCLYYGDEIGMQGYRDPFNRAFFCWDSHEERLRPVLAQLAQLRHSCEAFRTGELRVLRAEDGILHYQRIGKTETAEIIVNRSEHIIVEPLASGKHTEVNPMGFTIVVEENGHNPNHSYYDIQ